MKSLLSLLMLAAGLAGPVGPTAAAPVETFVMSVGGESRLIPPFGCSVFAAPAPVMAYFGAIAPGIPTEGLATCQIAGGFNHQTAPAGTLADATSLNVAFNTTQPVPNTFQGSAAAQAQSGVLAAAADAHFTGPANSMIVEGASSFGKFTETFTLHSTSHADGAAGLLVFGVSLAGAVQVGPTPPFYALGGVELRYQQGNGPIFNLFRAQHDGTTPFVATLADVSNTIGDTVAGFTLGAQTISGSGEVETFALPFVFGTPFDFTLGLMAHTVPGTDGTAQSQFNTWVSRLAPTVGGVPVADFSVVTLSGTPYGPGGVLPVPETPSALLFALGAVALLMRRRSA